MSRPGAVLAVLSLASLLTSYVEAMVVPSLPKLQAALSATNEEAAWVLSAYLVVGASAAPLMGRMGDAHGKRRLYIASLGAYVAAVALAGFAPSVGYLIAVRAIQGLGLSLFPLGIAIVTDVFPRDRVATAQGILSATVAIGMTLGMIAGAYIEEYLGWRAMFHVAAALSLAVLAAAAATLPPSAPARGVSVDYLGSLLVGSATAAALAYLTEAPYRGWTSPGQLALAAASAALYAGFAARELSAPSPLMPPRYLGVRNVAVANAAGLVSGIYMFMLFLGVIYFAEAPPPYGLGLGVVSAALTLLPATLAMIFLAPLIGSVVTNLGPKVSLAYGSPVSALGFLLLLGYRWSPLDLMVGSLVAGTGIVLVLIPIVNMVAVSMPAEDVSVGLGMNTLFRFLGAAVGPVVVATLMTDYQSFDVLRLGGMELVISGLPAPAAFDYTFIIAAALSIATLAIGLAAENYVLGSPGSAG
ncbi:MAG: MFS transporter [Nitrososphaeria archaeon]|jgi:MFS family permease